MSEQKDRPDVVREAAQRVCDASLVYPPNLPAGDPLRLLFESLAIVDEAEYELRRAGDYQADLDEVEEERDSAQSDLDDAKDTLDAIRKALGLREDCGEDDYTDAIAELKRKASGMPAAKVPA